MLSLGPKEWLLIIISTALLSYFLSRLLETDTERSHEKIKSLLSLTSEDKKDREEELSLFQRLYKMFENAISGVISDQQKKGRLSDLSMKIQQSGLNTTTIEMWSKVFIYAIIGSFIGILTKNVVAVVAFTALGGYLPFYQLKNTIEKRQFELLNDLPDFLDLVAITFPTCSSIEETFSVVCKEFENEISSEFQMVVDEINLGKNKRIVYRDLSVRTGLKEITTLTSQINQAESFGTGLESVLISQAKSIRHAKKILAEKKGASAKLMMYLPSMLLLIIALGIITFPFIMPIIESFTGGTFG